MGLGRPKEFAHWASAAFSNPKEPEVGAPCWLWNMVLTGQSLEGNQGHGIPLLVSGEGRDGEVPAKHPDASLGLTPYSSSRGPWEVPLVMPNSIKCICTCARLGSVALAELVNGGRRESEAERKNGPPTSPQTGCTVARSALCLPLVKVKG